MELRRDMWPAGSAAGKSRVRFWAPVWLQSQYSFQFGQKWGEGRLREGGPMVCWGLAKERSAERLWAELSPKPWQPRLCFPQDPSTQLKPPRTNKPQLPILGKGRDHSLPSAFYSHRNSSPGQIPDILLAKGTWAYFLSPLTELMPHPANSGRTEGPNLPPQEKQATSPVSLTLTFHSQRRAPGCGFLAGSSDL